MAQIDRHPPLSPEMIERAAEAIARVWTSGNKNVDLAQATQIFLLSARAALKAAIPEAVEAEREKARVLRRNFAEYLVPAYIATPIAIANICDEQLDRTGNLLGYVREAARARSAKEVKSNG